MATTEEQVQACDLSDGIDGGHQVDEPHQSEVVEGPANGDGNLGNQVGALEKDDDEELPNRMEVAAFL